MAAAIARTYCRLICYRHQDAAFLVRRNVKCFFQTKILQRRSLLVSSSRAYNADHGPQHEPIKLEKVSTDEDAEKHSKICRFIFGKGGVKIKQLSSELGLGPQNIQIESGLILVSAADTEIVKRAAQRMEWKVQKAKNIINPPFAEKVLTDEDAEKHNKICGIIIGKRGVKIKQLSSELGLRPQNIQIESGHILVSAADTELVKRAAQRMELEVQKAKNIINPPFEEKVLTEEDVDKHSTICGMVIGKGGVQIELLKSELGLGPQSIQAQESDHILVSGVDTELVKQAAERIELEVQKAKHFINRPITEKVLTDEDGIVDW